MSFKIYHDSDAFEIISKVNHLLEKHNLKFEFQEGEFDGYEIVELTSLTLSTQEDDSE
jgi:hypothetical protein